MDSRRDRSESHKLEEVEQHTRVAMANSYACPVKIICPGQSPVEIIADLCDDAPGISNLKTRLPELTFRVCGFSLRQNNY